MINQDCTLPGLIRKKVEKKSYNQKETGNKRPAKYIHQPV